jgi:hypothetical protein
MIASGERSQASSARQISVRMTETIFILVAWSGFACFLISDGRGDGINDWYGLRPLRLHRDLAGDVKRYLRPDLSHLRYASHSLILKREY